MIFSQNKAYILRRIIKMPHYNKSFKQLQSTTRNQYWIWNKHTFDLSITPPIVGNLPYISSGQGDFVVLSCTAPGRQIGTEEKAIWGPVYNIPSERIYSGDFEMTCHYSKALHDYINDWMNLIKSRFSNNDRVEYYDNIIGGLRLSVNNANHTETVYYNMYNVFPVTINGLDLNAGSQNELQTISISWSFREFEMGDTT